MRIDNSFEAIEHHYEERSCGRKIRYNTRAHALAVRRRMSERLKVYGPCEFCGGYHVGTPGLNTRGDFDRKTGRRKDKALWRKQRRKKEKFSEP